MAYLLTGWDIARTGAMKVSISDGTDSGTLSLSGTLAHDDLSSVMGAGEYTDLVTDFDAAADAILTTNGLDTISWSSTTGLYTITSSPNLTLDFTSATLGDSSGKRLAEAMGFNYNHTSATGGSASDPYNVSLSGASSYVSNVTPAYYLALARDGVSDYERPSVVKGQIERVTSSSGNGYAVGPATFEKRIKFRVRFQTLAATHASEQDDTAAPWTYEDLCEHAGAWEPVVLSHSGETNDAVFLLVEPEFDSGKVKPVWSNYHGKWDLEIAGQYLGRLA